MSSQNVRFKPLRPNVPIPARMTQQAAGFDLMAALDAAVTLKVGERSLIPCGFSMALPHGYEAQIRPRSGLAWRHGVTTLNAPGTIDADYRGEVCVILINLGQEPYTIEPGARIAQMVFACVAPLAIEEVYNLDDTARGKEGFGSTG